MHLFTKLFRVDFAKEEARRRSEEGVAEIQSKTFLVTNPALDGKSVREALAHFDPPGFVLSRILQGGEAALVTGETILHLNDRVVTVGDAKANERARVLFGKMDEDFLEEGLARFVSQRIFVSNKDVIGKRISELGLQKQFQATITRVRRGDVDFVPSAGTVLESGDGLRIMSREENIEGLKTFFGDSVKAMAETDFLSLSIGIMLGILLGMVPIPLPNGMVFKLGFAGGPLVVSLLLGKIERTGPLLWRIPFNANLALRQIGLVLFLAAIGTKAGQGVTATLHVGGIEIHRRRGGAHHVRGRPRPRRRLQVLQAAHVRGARGPFGDPDPTGLPGLCQPAGAERNAECLVCDGLSRLDGGQDHPGPAPDFDVLRPLGGAWPGTPVPRPRRSTYVSRPRNPPVIFPL